MKNTEGESNAGLYPFVLTEEQEHLRREIRDFAAREIAPNMMAWDEASEFPLAAIKEAWSPADCSASSFRQNTVAQVWDTWTTPLLSRNSPPSMDRLASPWPAHNSLGTNHILSCRQRRAEEEILTSAHNRGVAGCVGIDRARLRIRCWRRTIHRSEEGRSIRTERQQDIYYQWTLCRCRGGYCSDR